MACYDEPGGMTMENQKSTMTVPQMRQLLGLKKTESYWLVHRGFFKTDIIGGQMMVDVDSFEKWYANQVKHKKVDGPEPGSELRKMSYSFAEAANLLGVSDAVVYEIWNKNHLETFTVDYVKRIPKDIFEKWYMGQTKYQKRQHGSHVGAKACDYISREEAARMARVAPATISRWAGNNRFQYTKTDKLLRIKRKSFENWLDVWKG